MVSMCGWELFFLSLSSIDDVDVPPGSFIITAISSISFLYTPKAIRRTQSGSNLKPAEKRNIL